VSPEEMLDVVGAFEALVASLQSQPVAVTGRQERRRAVG
jgi:hypothetical protein